MGLKLPCLLLGGSIAITASIAVSGCDPTVSCTLAEHPAGLILHFEGPGGSALPSATYEVVLDVIDVGA